MTHAPLPGLFDPQRWPLVVQATEDHVLNYDKGDVFLYAMEWDWHGEHQVQVILQNGLFCGIKHYLILADLS